MVFEETLFQYGVSGVMLAYFIYDKIKFQSSIVRIIENNTIAQTKVYEVISNCKLRNMKGGR